MTDLYDTLGVDKTADAATIKKAFRSRAKKHHPDAGGDAKKFHALVKAHDVLSDPQRRAKYDETGDESDKPNADNVEAMARSRAMEAVGAAMQANLKNLAYVDIVSEAKVHVRVNIAAIEKNIAGIQEGCDLLRQAVKRFRKKKRKAPSASPDDLLIQVIMGQINMQEREIGERREAMKPFARALEILGEWEYEHEQKPKQGASNFFLGGGSGSGSAF